MNNVSQKKSRNSGMTQIRVEPLPIPLIKSKHNYKLEKYFIKIKLCRGPTSSLLGLYEFKMALFDNGETEELLLLVWNFNMTFSSSGTLATGAKFNIFVLYYMENFYISFTFCLQTWKVRNL